MTCKIIIKFNIDTAFSNLSKLPIIAKKSAKFILLFSKKRTAMNLISVIPRSMFSTKCNISHCVLGHRIKNAQINCQLLGGIFKPGKIDTSYS